MDRILGASASYLGNIRDSALHNPPSVCKNLIEKSLLIPLSSKSLANPAEHVVSNQSYKQMKYFYMNIKGSQWSAFKQNLYITSNH